MMVSPETYIDEKKHLKYNDLLKVRDKLLKEIYEFENLSKQVEEANNTIISDPSPEVIYQCNLIYLSKICDLIAKRYNEEYITF